MRKEIATDFRGFALIRIKVSIKINVKSFNTEDTGVHRVMRFEHLKMKS